ncbi:hypothetical protein [Silvimonas amylolytica]|uniref:hypothetical protein n=1 Tax=Silvimonas amylolytica TaxID=449663 RepID=UPI00166C9F1A|nr:hypothetical protein [Silvimonas amylolytica]
MHFFVLTTWQNLKSISNLATPKSPKQPLPSQCALKAFCTNAVQQTEALQFFGDSKPSNCKKVVKKRSYGRFFLIRGLPQTTNGTVSVIKNWSILLKTVSKNIQNGMCSAHFKTSNRFEQNNRQRLSRRTHRPHEKREENASKSRSMKALAGPVAPAHQTITT